MKKRLINRLIPLVTGVCLLLTLGLPALAQSSNLLQNGGFEAPFNTLDGDPPRQVAQGWTPWHIPAAPGAPSFANLQPEYESTAPDSTRILEGSDAQLIRSFFATHEGGVYQRVTGLTPGTMLRFQVSAYVWSNTFDNVDTSEEDGDVFVQVGIDPVGGTDATSADIVWSPAGVEQYDAYNLYEVEAEAEDSAVTVFVRTTIGIPVKNNHIYLDEAALETVGAVPDEATEEATEEPAIETEAAIPADTVEPTTPTEEGLEETATEESEAIEPVEQTATAVIAQATEAASIEQTETAAQPSSVPTEDGLQLTATALIAQATETANAVLTEAAPEITPTEDPMVLTATVIIAQATETAAAALTQAAGVSPTVEATATEDPTILTATAIIAQATETAAVAFTQTAAVSPTSEATATEDPIFATATAIIAGATSTAEANLTATAGAGAGEPTATFTPTAAETQVPISEAFPSTITHTVQAGETVAILADRYGSTVDAIVEANGLDSNFLIQVGQGLIIPVRLPAPATATPTSAVVVVTATPDGPVPALGSGNVYVVRPGDSLSRIARLFNTSVDALAQLNGIVNIDRIQVGQELQLPAADEAVVSENTPTPVPTAVSSQPQATYTVRPGDSLYKIALFYGVPVAQLAQANNIVNRNRIYVGQVLIIP